MICHANHVYLICCIWDFSQKAPKVLNYILQYVPIETKQGR